ncbi:universal stress protein [Cryptosporangium aurantiacum]|uniref:universal stress protein n=1 Tax=Cryptosporangium aurantiacum TaxID=134849 RepID=UPI0015BB47B0|nr:universal stress protein [Cryptosporangium aurantiacum]
MAQRSVRDGRGLILAGVDGSPTSVRAGAYAAGLARRQNADFLVVYVATRPALASMSPEAVALAEEAVEQSVAELKESVESSAAWAGVPVRFLAVRGDPYTEICRIAGEERADAVVVGASTHAGHRWVGSLAVRLVKAGRWPVTVVP